MPAGSASARTRPPRPVPRTPAGGVHAHLARGRDDSVAVVAPVARTRTHLRARKPYPGPWHVPEPARPTLPPYEREPCPPRARAPGRPWRRSSTPLPATREETEGRARKRGLWDAARRVARSPGWRLGAFLFTMPGRAGLPTQAAARRALAGWLLTTDWETEAPTSQGPLLSRLALCLRARPSFLTWPRCEK